MITYLPVEYRKRLEIISCSRGETDTRKEAAKVPERRVHMHMLLMWSRKYRLPADKSFGRHRPVSVDRLAREELVTHMITTSDAGE